MSNATIKDIIYEITTVCGELYVAKKKILKEILQRITAFFLEFGRKGGVNLNSEIIT